MDLLISNGTILTMNPARAVLVGANVLVRDRHIVQVGNAKPRAGKPCRVIDASNKLVIPGLIHGHLHACQTLFRNQADGGPLLEWLRKRIWPLEAAHTESSMRAAADLAFAELMKSGATAALDMGTVRHTDVLFQSARDCGFRLTSGKAMMDVGEGLPSSLKETAQESIAESLSLIERWHNREGGRLRYALAPRFALSCSNELLLEVGHQAVARNVRIHTHASESWSECEEVLRRTGKSSVEFFHSLSLTGRRATFAHGVWLSQKERQLLSETQTCVCHCPSSNLKLGSGIADVPALLRSGVPVCLGADGAACNNNLDLFMEMRLAALIHTPRAGVNAVSAMQALEMATVLGARALGLESEIGSIEEGKRADLALVDRSRIHSSPRTEDVVGPLVYSARASDVTDLVIDGRLVMSDGDLLTLDEERVVALAAEEAHRLHARVESV